MNTEQRNEILKKFNFIDEKLKSRSWVSDYDYIDLLWKLDTLLPLVTALLDINKRLSEALINSGKEDCVIVERCGGYSALEFESKKLKEILE